MANGTTSVITVNTVPTVDAIGTVKNTATVKSATTDPNPANNTSTDVLQVRKKPQPPIVPPKPQISKGSMLISVGKTVAGQQIRLKVVCIPLVTDRTTPRGDVLPCQITKLGRGQVRVTTEIPVTVVATYSARELQGWFAYRETKRYLLRP
jgi:hypothetical protein